MVAVVTRYTFTGPAPRFSRVFISATPRLNVLLPPIYLAHTANVFSI